MNQFSKNKKNYVNLLLTLSFLPLPNALAGIPKNDIAKWQLIKDDFFIDTEDFKVTKNTISLWIREKNYKKRRLLINCKNLTETEFFGAKQTQSFPILPRTIKYEIANQLCFLTDVNSFTREIRKPSWAKKIILTEEKNKKKINLLKEPINETKTESTKKEKSEGNNKKKFKFNNTKIEATSEKKSEGNNKKKSKLRNLFRFWSNN